MQARTRVHRTGTSLTHSAGAKLQNLLFWLLLAFLLPISLGAGWIVLNKIVQAHSASTFLFNAEMKIPVEIVKQAREIDE